MAKHFKKDSAYEKIVDANGDAVLIMNRDEYKGNAQRRSQIISLGYKYKNATEDEYIKYILDHSLEHIERLRKFNEDFEAKYGKGYAHGGELTDDEIYHGKMAFILAKHDLFGQGVYQGGIGSKYEITVNNDAELKEVENELKDAGAYYEVHRVTNKEHPHYGKKYVEFTYKERKLAKGGTTKHEFRAYTILPANKYGQIARKDEDKSKSEPTKFYISWSGNSYGLSHFENRLIDSYVIFDDEETLKKAIDKVRYSSPTNVNYGLSPDQKFYKEYLPVSEKFEYAHGGKINSERRFTRADYDKLMQSDEFFAESSDLNKWDILYIDDEVTGNVLVGEWNSKRNILKIIGTRTQSNPLVKWLKKNSFLQSFELDAYAHGGTTPTAWKRFLKWLNEEI